MGWLLPPMFFSCVVLDSFKFDAIETKTSPFDSAKQYRLIPNDLSQLWPFKVKRDHILYEITQSSRSNIKLLSAEHNLLPNSLVQIAIQNMYCIFRFSSYGNTVNRFHRSKYPSSVLCICIRRLILPIWPSTNVGTYIKVKTRYFEKFKINISTLHIQMKLST